MYNGFVINYEQEQIRKLLDLSNYFSYHKSNDEYPEKVFLPNPALLHTYGIDHSPRPYRIFVLKDRLVIPEFFTFDFKKWFSTYYSKIMDKKSDIEGFFLQGIDRTFSLLSDGSFYTVPSFLPNSDPVKIQFNDKLLNSQKFLSSIKYNVESGSFAPEKFQGSFKHSTVNTGINYGWRITAENKYDLSVIFHIQLVDNPGISFRVMLSDFSTKDNIPFTHKIDNKTNIYHINEMIG